jgi:hypothetical protein
MADIKTTAALTKELAETFGEFDTQMQKITANLDPDNVRTAGAMTLETGMYANNLAKILNDLIGTVQALALAQGHPELAYAVEAEVPA